jgi:hypothetical protein
MYIDYYRKERALSLIQEMLELEGLKVSPDCTKCWVTPRMNYNDVLRGINYVKSLGSNVIVYTNQVLLKERIMQDHDILILDISDLEKLCYKHKMIEFMDLVTM